MNNIDHIGFHEHKFGSFNLDCTFESRDTLQSLVQSCSCGHNRDCTSLEKSIRSPDGNIQECQYHHQPQKNNGSVTLDSSRNSSLISFKISIIEQEKEQPTVSCGGAALVDSSNVVSRKESSMKKKKVRIRWTKDLDEKFIESVDRLGGARKATPKEILKLMNCNGLTIFHVKSHLQKYRVARVMQEATKGNDEQLDSKTGMQIVEALRLQIDVQRHIFEQLESQKKLQMMIEEQAKQLKDMLKCQPETI